MSGPMKKTLQVNARVELEELYQGIPDDSVNLTFQDLASVNSSDNRNSSIATNEPISKAPSHSLSHSPMLKPPSFDFSKGLHASNQGHVHHDNNYSHHHHQDFGHGGNSPLGHLGRHHRVEDDRRHGRFSHASGGGAQSPHQSRSIEYSMGYDSVSGVSLASGRDGAGGRRRRPGIPHSKICSICSNYVYLLRTRCLVCGRVYCRLCVEIGMGEMIEGRKCIECLGLRFSQRYIERAGKVGCCSWRYPSTLKHVELRWAEKGPRRNGDRGYGHHGMGSSRPTPPRSPLSNEPSFVMSATSSPYRHFPL